MKTDLKYSELSFVHRKTVYVLEHHHDTDSIIAYEIGGEVIPNSDLIYLFAVLSLDFGLGIHVESFDTDNKHITLVGLQVMKALRRTLYS